MTSLVLWTSIKNCIVRLICFLFKRDVFSFFLFLLCLSLAAMLERDLLCGPLRVAIS